MKRFLVLVLCFLVISQRIARADDYAPLHVVLGASYVASEADCNLVVALTDLELSEVDCYYTYLPIGAMESGINRYVKQHEIPHTEYQDVYNAPYITVGGSLVGMLKSKSVGLYILMIERINNGQ